MQKKYSFIFSADRCDGPWNMKDINWQKNKMVYAWNQLGEAEKDINIIINCQAAIYRTWQVVPELKP